MQIKLGVLVKVLKNGMELYLELAHSSINQVLVACVSWTHGTPWFLNLPISFWFIWKWRHEIVVLQYYGVTPSLQWWHPPIHAFKRNMEVRIQGMFLLVLGC